MGRKRMLSPEFFTSATMNALPMQTMLLFAGFWCFADDKGRGEDDENFVAASVFPRRPYMSAKRVRADLDKLTAAGVLCRYSVCDIPLIHAVSWAEHQSISHATKSKLPPCQFHEPEEWAAFMLNNDPALHRFRTDSGMNPEDFGSGSNTVQFKLVKVSQVQNGPPGVSPERSDTPSPNGPASNWA